MCELWREQHSCVSVWSTVVNGEVKNFFSLSGMTFCGVPFSNVYGNFPVTGGSYFFNLIHWPLLKNWAFKKYNSFFYSFGIFTIHSFRTGLHEMKLLCHKSFSQGISVENIIERLHAFVFWPPVSSHRRGQFSFNYTALIVLINYM